jgi:hypothetical protein
MTAISVDDELRTIAAEMRETNDRLQALVARWFELQKVRWSVRCCRCWPIAVADSGRCRCCDYDHARIDAQA